MAADLSPHAVEEKTLYVQATARMLNLLTSIMPCLEGLFLASVIDGKNGWARLSFDGNTQEDVLDFCRDMETRYPGEWSTRSDLPQSTKN